MGPALRAARNSSRGLSEGKKGRGFVLRCSKLMSTAMGCHKVLPMSILIMYRNASSWLPRILLEEREVKQNVELDVEVEVVLVSC